MCLIHHCNTTKSFHCLLTVYYFFRHLPKSQKRGVTTSLIISLFFVSHEITALCSICCEFPSGTCQLLFINECLISAVDKLNNLDKKQKTFRIYISFYIGYHLIIHFFFCTFVYYPVGTIAENVFLTIWHCILSTELTKDTLLQTVFWRFSPLGKSFRISREISYFVLI